MTVPVLGVHGVGNHQPDLTPEAAADRLAGRWTAALAAGYRDGGLDGPGPDVAAAYYAHLLADHAQGAGALDTLTPREQEWAWAWLTELGVPGETAQGHATRPLRQGLEWLARRRGPGSARLARFMAAFLREVFVYVSRPATRQRVRQAVIAQLERHRPRVVVAHSLGSVVTYEALHQRPDLVVQLLVTVGSPLAMPEVVFDCLDPEPVDGRGARPAGVRRWVNLADPGDLVAVPRDLDDRFDVDLHSEAAIGVADFHTMSGYLSSGLTALAVQPYV